MATTTHTELKADWDRATAAREAAFKAVDAAKDKVLDAVHNLRDSQGKWDEAAKVAAVVEAFEALEAAEAEQDDALAAEDEAYDRWWRHHD